MKSTYTRYDGTLCNELEVRSEYEYSQDQGITHEAFSEWLRDCMTVGIYTKANA